MILSKHYSGVVAPIDFTFEVEEPSRFVFAGLRVFRFDFTPFFVVDPVEFQNFESLLQLLDSSRFVSRTLLLPFDSLSQI